MKCPESIEDLEEITRNLPLCRITLYEQAKARIEKGAAKSVSEAARQIGDETGRSPETIRRDIRREDRTGTLSQLAGTSKHRPLDLTDSDEKAIVGAARNIKRARREHRQQERANGGDAQRTRLQQVTESRPTLSDLGLSKRESSQAQMIASLPEETFNAVKSGKKTITQVKREIKKENIKKNIPKNFETCTISDLKKLIESGKKFGTIYADPPWPYQNQGTRSSTSGVYKADEWAMSLDDLKAMPVPQLTTEQCHLHLWTTNGFLRDAFQIIDAWGFEYKSCFVWVKPQMGIGNYWRVSHEFMLLGVKGKKVFNAHDEMSWLSAGRTGHSVKPEAIAKKIEKVSPGPWLELFGRRCRENWAVWGNEIERDLFNGKR